jgi:hypothetical protein
VVGVVAGGRGGGWAWQAAGGGCCRRCGYGAPLLTTFCARHLLPRPHTLSHVQVIYHDDDFETFLDADGSTHYYKELEMNARGLYWDLILNRPYDDQGYENSSRVFPNGWDMFPRVLSAVATDGVVSDPAVPATRWSVEIGLPLADLVFNTSATAPPAPGDFWRINFSRVEWATRVVGGAYWLEPSCQSCPVPGTPTEDNWVWSPQGAIAMHLPERWGQLQFAAGPVNGTPAVVNPEWPVRAQAAALYYAQHAWAAGPGGGNFTDDVAALARLSPTPWALNGTCSAAPPVVTLSPGGAGFVGWIVDAGGAMAASITDDRYLRVFHGGDAVAAGPGPQSQPPGRRHRG